ncbi:hypothetical protein TRAPUB_7912 [Trametes pubescens]|uniref:Uncharacterized protein n=1 Tax=Trametes pubescens TaxID=154538 RepID=A0A1M2V250_TRAPU|nr:hypothetical protein TRAPUB_7912 [Trametes pubescens]
MDHVIAASPSLSGIPVHEADAATNVEDKDAAPKAKPRSTKRRKTTGAQARQGSEDDQDYAPTKKPRNTKRKTSNAAMRQAPDKKVRNTTANPDLDVFLSSFQASPSLTAQPARNASPGPSARPVNPPQTYQQWQAALGVTPRKKQPLGSSQHPGETVLHGPPANTDGPRLPATTSPRLSIVLLPCDPPDHQHHTNAGATGQAGPTRSASSSLGPGHITFPFNFSALPKSKQRLLEAAYGGPLPARTPQPLPFLQQPFPVLPPSAQWTPEQMGRVVKTQRMLRQRNVDRDDSRHRLRPPAVDGMHNTFLGSHTQSIASTSTSGGLTQAGRFGTPPKGVSPHWENAVVNPSWEPQQNASTARPRRPLPSRASLRPPIAGSKWYTLFLAISLPARSTCIFCSFPPGLENAQLEGGLSMDVYRRSSAAGDTNLWPGRPPTSMARPFNEGPSYSSTGDGWADELRARLVAVQESQMQQGGTPAARTSSASAGASRVGTPSDDSDQEAVADQWVQRTRTPAPLANAVHAFDAEHPRNALMGEYQGTRGDAAGPGGLRHSDIKPAYSSGDGWVGELRMRFAAAQESQTQRDGTPVASTSSASVMRSTRAGTSNGESDHEAVTHPGQWGQRTRTSVANTAHAPDAAHLRYALMGEYERTRRNATSLGGRQHLGTMARPSNREPLYSSSGSGGGWVEHLRARLAATQETQSADVPDASSAPTYDSTRGAGMSVWGRTHGDAEAWGEAIETSIARMTASATQQPMSGPSYVASPPRAHMPARAPSFVGPSAMLRSSSSSADPSASKGSEVEEGRARMRRSAWNPETDVYAGH